MGQSVLAEVYTASQIQPINYEPTFPPSFSIIGSQAHYKNLTPSIQPASIKPDSRQEIVPRLRSTRAVTTRADPDDIFIELWIESDNRPHSIHTLSDCMSMVKLFDKVATAFGQHSISRLSAEFKDDNVVRFWKFVLNKDGNPSKWKKAAQLASERQTDVVDGTIIVTVEPCDITSLPAIEV